MTPTTAAFFEKIWAIEAQNRIDFPKAHALAQQRYPDLYKRMIDASKGRATELLNARPSAEEAAEANDRQAKVSELVNAIMDSRPSFTYDMAYERVRREHPEIFAAMRQPMRQGAEFNNKSNLSTKEGVAAVARQIEHGTRTPQQQHSAGVVIDAKAETEAVNAMFSQLNSSGWERYIRAHQEDVSGANARMIFTAVVKKWADKQDIQWADAWGQMAKSFDRPYQQMDVMPQAAY